MSLLTRAPRLEADGLTLGPLEEKDRAPLLRMAADGRIQKTYMLPDLNTPAEEDAFFPRLQALSASPERFVYGIFLDGQLIGFLNEVVREGDEIELGYFIDPAYWGRGCAARALRAAKAIDPAEKGVPSSKGVI